MRYVFILPQLDKPIKVKIVDENRRTQFCNQCRHFTIYKHLERINHCLACGSNDIEEDFQEG
jgi:hypothetical protein